MSLAIHGSVERSVLTLNSEIKQYFHISRKFRSRLRKGAIVVVERTTKTRDLISSLIHQCDLDFHVLHFTDVKCARKKIESLNPSEIKVVVVDSGMVERCNGNSLPAWLNENHPDVPVLVSNCDPNDERDFAKMFSERIGLVSRERPMASFLEDIGMPLQCCRLVSSHGR